MKNVSHKEIWHTGAVKIHVELPSITVIESKNGTKSEKYCVKI